MDDKKDIVWECPPARKVVLTGGPGGGKTTAVDLFRRELGDRYVVVPETATILFAGGFPRSKDDHARACVQRAIFHVQRNLEDTQSWRYRDRILLCDRGTVDGAVYWPGLHNDFFENMETTLEAELNRYDAVLYFESAAVGGMGIEGGNPIRTETLAEAAKIDYALRKLWSKHPQYNFIPHHVSFLEKIRVAFEAMKGIIAQLEPIPGEF